MLSVETGAGLPDADSFFALPDADAFLPARGFPEWEEATEMEQEQAARQAADYLGFAYTWTGTPTSDAQRLCWPRAGVVRVTGVAVPSNAVPREVREAAMLLATAALSASLIAPTQPAEQAIVSERQELAGVGSKQVQYAVGEAATGGGARFPEIAALLSGLTTGSAFSGRNAVHVTQPRRA